MLCKHVALRTTKLMCLKETIKAYEVYVLEQKCADNDTHANHAPCGLHTWFLVSMASLFVLSSALYFSASWTILSTSSLLSVLAPVILMSCFFCVPLSVAVTLRIPLASMSNLTSTWGTPLGAGGMPSSLKLPRLLLSFTNSRSPAA